jgi:hypothetical protein
MTTLGQIVGPDVPVILPWSCFVRTCCESEVTPHSNRGVQARPFAQRFSHHSYQARTHFAGGPTRRSFVDRWKV